MNELQESLGAQYYRMNMHQPRYGYCANGCRFGQCNPPCLDCSGSQYVAYRAALNFIIPASTSLMARWGRDNHQNRDPHFASFGDLMIHSSRKTAQYPNGDPYNSDGPVGHVGGFVRYEIRNGTLGCWTWESASSQHGWGLCWRALSFWVLAVRHPAFDAMLKEALEPTEEDEDNDMATSVKGFFAHTDEPVDKPGAKGQGPGAQWWLLLESGIRMKVLSPAHRDWYVMIEKVYRKADGTPDTDIRAIPAQYLYEWTYNP